MLSLQELHLTQFRNYNSGKFYFKNKITGIYGKNGSGKTNLLDAVYYLCFTRSYFSRTDVQSVEHGKEGMRLQGEFLLQKNNHKTVCILRENNKKEFWMDEEQYPKFSLHLGKFPAVMITPDDTALITDGSEERRKFIDTIICQIEPDYLNNLIAYNKILQQRNSLLKQIFEQQKTDEALLDILDTQLAENGQKIYEARKNFMIEFLPAIEKHYKKISNNNYDITVQYESQLHNGLLEKILIQNRQKDKYSQRTNGGIHKDDLSFNLKSQPFKQIASQGQRKSLLFALKLAEYDVIKAHKGFSPILLLDDVFEKLDAERMHNLLEYVCGIEDAQVFITDTHKERLHKHLEDVNAQYDLIELN